GGLSEESVHFLSILRQVTQAEFGLTRTAIVGDVRVLDEITAGIQRQDEAATELEEPDRARGAADTVRVLSADHLARQSESISIELEGGLQTTNRERHDIQGRAHTASCG